MLAAAIVAELGGTALRLFQRPPEHHAAGVLLVPPARRATNLSTVIAAHLFGKSATDVSGATESSRPAVLTGIIALEDPEAGYAMIGEDPTHARLVRAGAPVSAGITLKQVFRNYVVIDYGGRREMLRLPLPKGRPGFREQGRAVADSTEAQAPAGGGDVQDVMHSLGLRVSMRGHKRNGLQVATAGLGSEALDALGLYPGDMIVGVDQTSLTDADAPTDGGDLEQRLLEGSAQLTINRQGQLVEVVLDASRIARAAELYRAAVAADPDL